MFNNNDRRSTTGFSFPWRGGLFATLGAFVLAFVAMIFVGSLMALVQAGLAQIPPFNGMDKLVFGAAFELVSYVTMFGVMVYALRAFMRNGQSIGELTQSTLGQLRSKWLSSIGLGILGYVVAMLGTVALYSIFPMPEPYSPAGEFAKTLRGPAFIFFALSAVVAAPILEELVFRGFLQNMLRGSLRSNLLARWPGIADLAAVTLTAAIFAIMHGTLTGFPPLFITGLVLGQLYRRTNNLWAAIAMHACNNAIATLALWLTIAG